MDSLYPLTDLKTNHSATVHSLLLGGSMRRRLQDIGIIEGTRVECLQESPCGDMAAYLIRGAVIALRSEDSSNILVSN